MFDELLFSKPTGPSGIVMGTVGWEGVDAHFFPGELDNDGCTLVCVQLYDGRDNTKPLDPKRAQGARIICQIASHLGVPPKGASCYVAIPEGMHGPGTGVIIACVGGGNERSRNITDGDATLAPSGEDAGQALVIAKKDGTITIHTTDTNTPNGNSVFFRVSPDSFQFVAPWGRMIFDASGVHWTTKSGARLDFGGISIPGLPGLIADAFSSYAKLTAATVKLDGNSVYLGHGAYYQPAVSTLPTDANTLPSGVIVTLGPCPNLVGTPSVWLAAMSP